MNKEAENFEADKNGTRKKIILAVKMDENEKNKTLKSVFLINLGSDSDIF